MFLDLVNEYSINQRLIIRPNVSQLINSFGLTKTDQSSNNGHQHARSALAEICTL